MYVSIFSKGRSLLALFLSLKMISVAGKRQDLTSLHLMDITVMTCCLPYPLQCGMQQGSFLGGGTDEQMSGKGNLKPSRTTKKTQWEKIINIKVREYT
jgi:hypothetical protein